MNKITDEGRRQLEAMMKNQLAVIAQKRTQREREYSAHLCLGFLAGLLLTNAVSNTDFNRYKQELQELTKQLGAA